LRSRNGYLLAEALCALALAGLLAVACATTLLQSRRALAATEARARAQRSALDALAITAALVLDAEGITLLGDTAIEFSVAVAASVVCAREGTWLVLPPARLGAPTALAIISQAPEDGDEVRAFVGDTITGLDAWLAAPVDSASMRAAPDACTLDGRYVAPSDAGAPRLRIASATIDPRVRMGTPVRVLRRGRLALYSSGGEWMLGWRRCAHGACGVIQPVAGPLQGPAADGFRVRIAGPGEVEISVNPAGARTSITAIIRRTDAGR